MKNVGHANVTVASATFAGVPVAGFTAVNIAPYEERALAITPPFPVTMGVSYTVTLITADGAKFGFSVTAGRGREVYLLPYRIVLREYIFDMYPAYPAGPYSEIWVMPYNEGPREVVIVKIIFNEQVYPLDPDFWITIPPATYDAFTIILDKVFPAGTVHRLTFVTREG